MHTINLELQEIEWQILQDEIVDPENWINGFIAERIRRQRDYIIAKEQQTLIDDPTVETIPASEQGILESYFGREGYQTRAEQVAAENTGDP